MRYLWWKYLFFDIVGLLHFLTKIVSLFMIGHQHSIKLYIQPHFMFVKFSLKANLYLLEKKLWWRKIVFANFHQFWDFSSKLPVSIKQMNFTGENSHFVQRCNEWQFREKIQFYTYFSSQLQLLSSEFD